MFVCLFFFLAYSLWLVCVFVCVIFDMVVYMLYVAVVRVFYSVYHFVLHTKARNHIMSIICYSLYVIHSSVSSALNSLSAVILEDFIKPIRHRLELGELGERSAIWTSKILGKMPSLNYIFLL